MVKHEEHGREVLYRLHVCFCAENTAKPSQSGRRNGASIYSLLFYKSYRYNTNIYFLGELIKSC